MAYECAIPQLQIFDQKGIQYSILKTDQVMLKPLASIENSKVIQFLDQGYGDDYRNLNSVYLHLKAKMHHVKDDGTADAKDEITDKNLNVYPVNNLLHSLFRQITLTLNGKQIAQNSQNYAYRAYFENLLNWEPDSAAQHLSSIIWKVDTPKKFDSFGENLNGIDRGLLFPLGEEIDLVGRLHLDMLNTTKYLVNNVDFGLTFELAPQDFYLMKKTSTIKSELKILDAALYMDHIKLNPEVLLTHQRILQQKNALYPYKRCDVRNFTIAQNSTSFSIDNVCNGILPEFVLIAMVDNDAYQGKHDKNPFNFQHFGLTSFNASINGIEISPRKLEFDFLDKKNPRSQHAYFNLFSQLNLHRFDRANSITPQLFNNGAFILAYDLTPDHDKVCGNVIQTGSLRFEGQFAKTVGNAITILVYLQFDTELIIDKDRNVFPQMF